MTDDQARDLAEKILKKGFFDISDKDSVYKYGIDGLVEFVKNGILHGYEIGSKQRANLEKFNLAL